jgi:O-acetyl-ADP-ribose deacetylase (regulator of RNase III)
VWHGGNRGEAELLAKAYRSCLSLAVKEGIKTIAFPSISTGAYGYPLAEAAVVALRTVREFLSQNPGKLSEVRFVLFSSSDFAEYRAAWDKVKSV